MYYTASVFQNICLICILYDVFSYLSEKTHIHTVCMLHIRRNSYLLVPNKTVKPPLQRQLFPISAGHQQTTPVVLRPQETPPWRPHPATPNDSHAWSSQRYICVDMLFIVVVQKLLSHRLKARKISTIGPVIAQLEKAWLHSSFLRVCGMSEKTLDVKTVTCSHKAGWKRTCQIPIPPEERAHGVVETGCVWVLFFGPAVGSVELFHCHHPKWNINVTASRSHLLITGKVASGWWFPNLYEWGMGWKSPVPSGCLVSRLICVK